MTHSIRTSDAAEMLPHFQRLGRTLLAPGIEPRARLEQLFEIETGEFDLYYGYLTHIDRENETQRFEFIHGSHETIKTGTTIPLSKSYCKKTIADPEGTLAIDDAPAEGWQGDPAYEAWELKTYLGTTVYVDDELYGTFCFADTVVRDEPIADEEKALLEMLSKWIEYTRVHWDEPLVQEPRTDTVEGRSVSSEAIDSMMDALRRPKRRSILLSLLGETTETTISLEQQWDREDDRTELRHNHLPRLADAGYITYDREADTISRGPMFSEVEPLVQLLKEYNTALPE